MRYLKKFNEKFVLDDDWEDDEDEENEPLEWTLNEMDTYEIMDFITSIIDNNTIYKEFEYEKMFKRNQYGYYNRWLKSNHVYLLIKNPDEMLSVYIFKSKSGNNNTITLHYLSDNTNNSHRNFIIPKNKYNNKPYKWFLGEKNKKLLNKFNELWDKMIKTNEKPS